MSNDVLKNYIEFLKTMSSEVTTTIFVDGTYKARGDFYRFIFPKEKITMLHHVWLDEECDVDYAILACCDLGHECLYSFTLEVCRRGTTDLPFFFTRAYGGLPLFAIPYNNVGVDLYLKKPRNDTSLLKLGLCVSVEPDSAKFDKLVENQIDKILSLDYPNIAYMKGQIIDNCFEYNVQTSDKILAVAFRAKDANGDYILANDLDVKYYFDYFDYSDSSKHEYILQSTTRECTHTHDSIRHNSEYFKSDKYITVQNFVPDIHNLPVSIGTGFQKDARLKLEFNGVTPNFIELLCMRHQNVFIQGGSMGIKISI